MLSIEDFLSEKPNYVSIYGDAINYPQVWITAGSSVEFSVLDLNAGSTIYYSGPGVPVGIPLPTDSVVNWTVTEVDGSTVTLTSYQ